MGALRVVALTLALTLVLAAVALWRPGARQGSGGEPRTITVTARQFAYEPATIHTGVGERVRLVLTTSDVAHSLAIREYGINLIVTPGESASVVFTTDRPGRFLMYCTVYCGTGHPDHLGTLIVGDDGAGDPP